MNWIQYTDTRHPRATVWCLSKDLQAGATDGTYNFVDTEFEQNDVGDGTDIIVMDSGKLLFYSKENHVAYEFGSGGGGGGGDEPPAGYVTVAPKQSVTITSSEEPMVDLTTVEGYEYPESMPTNLKVFVNDTEASFNESEGAYIAEINSYYGLVYYNVDFDYYSYSFTFEDGNGDPVPGTYTVAIYAPEENQNEPPFIIDDKT